MDMRSWSSTDIRERTQIVRKRSLISAASLLFTTTVWGATRKWSGLHAVSLISLRSLTAETYNFSWLEGFKNNCGSWSSQFRRAVSFFIILSHKKLRKKWGTPEWYSAPWLISCSWLTLAARNFWKSRLAASSFQLRLQFYHKFLELVLLTRNVAPDLSCRTFFGTGLGDFLLIRHDIRCHKVIVATAISEESWATVCRKMYFNRLYLTLLLIILVWVNA